ncbi:DUF4105 domain-containing protein [Luteimonas yindakuii]|uniref:DUF7844 domain-containing protein n=1 Tax=Luteimonas yindakuii TaxID=2565782 RepID=UPI0010A55717|nr:DUF4105 domain-containing protein [Luteimonas yindakuii]QCO68752.1 DUF4105 domain-containing protein [Luteimonas yindakuii]
MPGANANGAVLPVTVAPVDNTAHAAAAALLQRAGATLPAALNAQLPPLRLHIVDTLPAHVQGRQRGRDIQLPRHLVIAPPGDDGPDPALAALVHELAHVLDGRLGLSREPRLLDLAGWQVRPRRFGLRNADNPLRDRSPDPYELHSPAEFVAVNLGHFLLDPHYRCRRPALHRHFTARLGSEGADPPAQPCADALPFVSPGDGAGRSPLESLDPARVHAVEYLFAEPTRAPMSRWGHSMLRLVVCAPERVAGPDCRFDLDHHRVLSFRAFVDDVQISSWRGLTGRYPSRLFVLPLSQVVEEYTRVELRGLRSVPLKLQPADIAALLERASQLHWTYDGRYSFLGNNCASETFKLLHDAVPRLASARLAAITPNGLRRKLERRGIVDASVLTDMETAVRLGYHFPAADAHYDALFDVAAAALAMPAPDARGWLELEAPVRAPWLQHGDLRATAALLVLEEAALRRAEVRARDALKRRLLRADDAHAVATRGLAEDVLAAEGMLVRPAVLLAQVPGYGLPQPDELAIAGERARVLDGARLDQSSDLRARAEAMLPPTVAGELAATRANVTLVAARLRRLSADDVAP